MENMMQAITIAQESTSTDTCRHCGKMFEKGPKQQTKSFCNRSCKELFHKDASWWRERWQRLRLRAMMKVDPSLRCECGCDVITILEINHKNGGGNKEFKQFYDNDVRKFWRAIIAGQRKTDDLDLRCKVCNIAHYVELLGVVGFQITYTKQ